MLYITILLFVFLFLISYYVEYRYGIMVDSLGGTKPLSKSGIFDNMLWAGLKTFGYWFIFAILYVIICVILWGLTELDFYFYAECINLNDIKSVLQQNEHPLLIRTHDDVTNITPRLQAEMTKVNPDKASKAVLRIGYSADVEVQYEQVQSILRIINDAIPNVNIVWGYGIDDKLPDGHCSILLLIG